MSNPPPPANSPTTPPLPRWRKYVRRGMIAGVGLLILLLAAFFMLPIWISNQQGRLYVLDRLNDRLHGPKVQVDSWQLGWFRNTELTNLRILAPDGTTIVTCPHVTSGLTLWDIFWSNYSFGNTTADQLELHITKYTDGGTSLDSFMQKDGAADEILRSARGALQINDGQIVIYSARTNQTLHYHDTKATLSIASSEAPFHLEIKAIGAPGESIAVSGTFPPTSTVTAESFLPRNLWTLAGDVDFSASQVPTGLACDFLNVDDAWVDSLGPALESVQFAGHAPALPALPPDHPDALHLTLQVKGISPAPPTAAASLDARMLLYPPANHGTGGQLLVAAPDGITMTLRQSPPLVRLLGRLNPLLGEVSPTPAGLIRATATNMTLPLDHPEKTQATLQVSFPPMLFTTHNGPSLLRQLQVTLGETANARIQGGAEPLRMRLADGQFNYENFVVTLGTRHINFSGIVTLDGQVNLSARIPDTNPGLAVSATQVVITGTAETPVLKRAE